MSNRRLVSSPESVDVPPHLRRHLLDRFQREYFEAFIHRAFDVVTPGQDYAHNWHISAIAHALDNVRRGESKRLIIAMPPRYLKSLCVSIAFPAFLLGHDPSLRIIAVSYAEFPRRRSFQRFPAPRPIEGVQAAFPEYLYRPDQKHRERGAHNQARLPLGYVRRRCAHRAWWAAHYYRR